MLSDAFQKALALRFPVFDREDDETTPRQRIEALEDHAVLCAFYHGELIQERFEIRDEHRGRLHVWNHLEGWEPLRRSKTEAAVDDAKRQMRPDLYDELATDRAKMQDLSEQIERLDREHDKASRIYSIMTGS